MLSATIVPATVANAAMARLRSRGRHSKKIRGMGVVGESSYGCRRDVIEEKRNRFERSSRYAIPCNELHFDVIFLFGIVYF